MLRLGVRHSLGRKAQVSVPINREAVRAFPHVAEVIDRIGTDIAPVLKVMGFIEEHTSLVILCPGAEHHIPLAVRFPYLRVSHVAGAEQGIILISQDNAFSAHVYAVCSRHMDDVGLSAARDVIIISRMLDISRIENMKRILADHRTAGINAIFILRNIRKQHCSGEFPVQKIPAAVVAPAFLAAAVCMIRCILKVDMIKSAEIT